jgi:NAD dependent epimerase/dehydratase family enzyme
MLKRPAILPAPAFALRLVLGEMADEALLSSACVAPKRLTSLGYRFAFEDLDRALRNALLA